LSQSSGLKGSCVFEKSGDSEETCDSHGMIGLWPVVDVTVEEYEDEEDEGGWEEGVVDECEVELV